MRRVAAILYHRRAGFSANGMGVWKVPEERVLEIGRCMAAVRGISHCYQRPTYADWPYSLFTMAHGRSKQECDAILDSIERRRASASAPRCTARRSSRRSGCCTSPTNSRPGSASTRASETGTQVPDMSDSRSAALYRRACEVMPGGVNSPVRAMRAIGRDPLFIAAGEGAELIDVDGNRYVDYVGSWGPLIHGHAHPAIVQAVTQSGGQGHQLRRADGRRGAAGPGGRGAHAGSRDAADDLLGHRGRDDGDPPRARRHRPREGAQVRGRLPRPRRRPAGARRLGARDPGAAVQPGRAAGRRRADDRRAVERPRGADRRHRGARAGRDPRRAAAGEHGARVARGGLPRAAARARRSNRRAARARRGDQRVSRRPRRGAGADGRERRPHDPRQGARRRAAGGRAGRRGRS